MSVKYNIVANSGGSTPRYFIEWWDCTIKEVPRVWANFLESENCWWSDQLSKDGQLPEHGIRLLDHNASFVRINDRLSYHFMLTFDSAEDFTAFMIQWT